jgi:hypothetical protein
MKLCRVNALSNPSINLKGFASITVDTLNSIGKNGPWSSKQDFTVADLPPVLESRAMEDRLNPDTDFIGWAGDHDQYWIYAGSSKGGSQYFDSKNLGDVKSTLVSNLPVDGAKVVHVRLWYRNNGEAWKFVDKEYLAGGPRVSYPVSNTLNSEFGSFPISLTDDGAGVVQYWLYAGSSPGARDYFDSSNLLAESNVYVTGLPDISQDVHIRLFWRFGAAGPWQRNDWFYLGVE